MEFFKIKKLIPIFEKNFFIKKKFEYEKKPILKLRDIYKKYENIFFLTNFDNFEKKRFLFFDEISGFWKYIQNIPKGFHKIYFFSNQKFILNLYMPFFVDFNDQPTNYIIIH